MRGVFRGQFTQVIGLVMPLFGYQVVELELLFIVHVVLRDGRGLKVDSFQHIKFLQIRHCSAARWTTRSVVLQAWKPVSVVFVSYQLRS